MNYEEKRKQVADHLVYMGYRSYGKDRLKQATLYQRRRSDEHKHFFNVWEYFETLPNGQTLYSYEIEMTFNTELDTWATVKYYSLGPDELVSSLDQYEYGLWNATIAMYGNPESYDEPTFTP